MRGTTRDPRRRAAIEAGGIEAAVADPERPETILELVGDVTAIHWLLGDAQAEPRGLEALHGDSLEALLEKLVDTPVRGFVYEASGRAPNHCLERGAALVRSAGQTWHIPVEIVSAEATDAEAWLDAMVVATQRLVSR